LISVIAGPRFAQAASGGMSCLRLVTALVP
jgi:hypothetical protein